MNDLDRSHLELHVPDEPLRVKPGLTLGTLLWVLGAVVVVALVVWLLCVS